MANPLYDQLFERHRTSQKAFLIRPDGSSVTYDAFLSLSDRFAATLTNQGLKAGDRLAVQIDKCPEFLAIFAACAKTGIIFLPLNTAYTASEIQYFVDDAEASLLLCDPKNKADLAMHINTQIETLEANGTGSFPDLAKESPADSPICPRKQEDLAAFLYTSGTTGRSKGAMLTQANLLSNAEVLADYWRFSESDVLLHALPVFHTHGLFVATNITLLAGGTMIFLPRFDLDEIIRFMPKATTMMGVPTFYTRLLGDDRFDQKLASHMRLFVSGSAPLLAETHETFEARTGHKILERYGMTETNMNTSNPYDGDRIAGTVGLPLPGVELKITDPASGNEIKQGEVGQIEVRGPNVFKGYWRMPEKTKEELRQDGFFITGDLGKIDESGYVQIVGRNKDLIISGGFNIYPKEVEAVLDDQPGVLESAVIGAPHPDFGEGVVGILAQSPGAAIELDQIKQAAKAQLAKFKLPKQLVVVDELPRNTMGKVQKNILRDTYRDIFST